MSFKLLKLCFAIGKFLAITPSRADKDVHSICQKIWAALIVLVLTVFTVFWFVQRNILYTTFIHIKFVMRVLRHLSKYVFCCYVVVTANFHKRKLWFKLIRKLELVSELRDGNKSCLDVLSFCVAHVLFWSVMAFAGYMYNDYYHISFGEIVVAVLWQWYCLFLYNYLICVVLGMLLARYRYLNALFRASSCKKINDSVHFNDGFLKRAEFILYTLKDAVDVFNSLFEWPILLNMLYSSLLVLDYVDDFFRTSTDYNHIKLYTLFFSSPCLAFPIVVVQILACHAIGQEMRKVLNRCYKLRRSCSTQKRQELNEFIDYCLLNNFPEFSAAGFFVIHKATLFTILGTLTTYLIIMVQFQNKAN